MVIQPSRNRPLPTVRCHKNRGTATAMPRPHRTQRTLARLCLPTLSPGSSQPSSAAPDRLSSCPGFLHGKEASALARATDGFATTVHQAPSLPQRKFSRARAVSSTQWVLGHCRTEKILYTNIPEHNTFLKTMPVISPIAPISSPLTDHSHQHTHTIPICHYSKTCPKRRIVTHIHVCLYMHKLLGEKFVAAGEGTRGGWGTGVGD